MKTFNLLIAILLVILTGCSKESLFDSESRYEDNNLMTANLSKKISEPVLFVDGLNSPEGMDFWGSTLYIVESQTKKLLKISSKGEISIFSEFNGGRLADVVTDVSRGLFVTDMDAGKIYLVKEDGSYSTFVSGLNQPTAITLNTNGDLFVTELRSWSGEKVTKISNDGTKTTVIVYDDTRDINPNGLVFDKQGNLYVVEHGTGEIKMFDINNNVWPIDASNIEPFVTLPFNPLGLIIDKNGNIWSINQHDLFTITPTGDITSVLSTLTGPYNGIGLSQRGDIYFCDYNTGEVFFIDKHY